VLPEEFVHTMSDILIPWGMYAMVALVIGMAIFMPTELGEKRPKDPDSKSDPKSDSDSDSKLEPRRKRKKGRRKK